MLEKLSSVFNFEKRKTTTFKLGSGRLIDVMIHGSRKKEVLLCIGGLGTPIELFSPLAEKLKDNNCLVSFEYQWGKWTIS